MKNRLNAAVRAEPCPDTLHPLQIVDHRIGDECRAISGRDLHRALGIRRDFNDWMRRQIKRGGLVEGEDFAVSYTKVGKGRPRIDYALTLDTGKHVCLMSGTPAGRAYRAHLIRCERDLIRLGTGAAQDLARLMSQLDAINARASTAGRDLGAVRRRRDAIERAAAPLRALVQPLLPGLEGEA